jgi:phage gp16-like protein
VTAARKAKTPRSTELAKIHIGAEQIGLRRHGDDSAYRDMLWSIARVRSAKDLDAGGRQAVLKHLRNCGFTDHSPKAGTERYKRGTPAALIRWLWTDLANKGIVQDRSDRALRRYIAKHAGLGNPKGVIEIAPQHLDRADANQVIEQLKRWLHSRETQQIIDKIVEKSTSPSPPRAPTE